MIRTATCALLVASGAAFGQAMPFTETFDTDNAGWGDGPGNPAAFAGGAITSQTVNAATDFFSPFPGAPAFATVFRTQPGTVSSGGAFAGDYLAGGITELSFDVSFFAPGPFGFFVRLADGSNINALSTETLTANPGGDTLTFSLDVADLSAAGPGGPLASRLATIEQLQIVAVQVPFASPTAGEYSFFLDNVSIDVPAPAGLAAFGVLGLGAIRRRR